ncbi:MAG: type II toxin-antitoxin system VapC family toxin [Caulobacteraceae bacterium]
MRLLLDTHAVIWWFLDDPALSRSSRGAIGSADAEVLVSAVSAMEITLKFRLGKLARAARLAANFEAMVLDYGFKPLSISLAHASLAGSLDFHHKDPFDRLLIAQALVEDMTLVSNERVFDSVGVKRLW